MLKSLKYKDVQNDPIVWHSMLVCTSFPPILYKASSIINCISLLFRPFEHPTVVLVSYWTRVQVTELLFFFFFFFCCSFVRSLYVYIWYLYHVVHLANRLTCSVEEMRRTHFACFCFSYLLKGGFFFFSLIVFVAP